MIDGGSFLPNPQADAILQLVREPKLTRLATRVRS